MEVGELQISHFHPLHMQPLIFSCLLISTSLSSSCICLYWAAAYPSVSQQMADLWTPTAHGASAAAVWRPHPIQGAVFLWTPLSQDSCSCLSTSLEGSFMNASFTSSSLQWSTCCSSSCFWRFHSGCLFVHWFTGGLSSHTVSGLSHERTMWATYCPHRIIEAYTNYCEPTVTPNHSKCIPKMRKYLAIQEKLIVRKCTPLLSSSPILSSHSLSSPLLLSSSPLFF